MLALTFSTGIIDAVGYLGLDRVFTGNMTGNVVILGMALVGAKGLPILGPVIALLGFMSGAAGAGRILRKVPSGWAPRSTALFVVTGTTLLTIGLVCLVGGQDFVKEWAPVVTTLLGVAMGMQAGTARRIAVKDVSTVVITSTLAGLAADSRVGGSHAQPWKRRAGAVALIGLGALAGASLLPLGFGWGPALSGIITLVVSWVGHRYGQAVENGDNAGDYA